jgi:uncharacterized protein YukE
MSEIKIDPEQLKKLADVYQQAEDEAENTLKELKWDTSELMLTLTLSSTGRIRDLQSELNHSIETFRQKVDETQEAVMIARAAIQSADRSMAAHFGVFALELVSYYDIQRIDPENEFDPITGKKLSDFDRDLALLMLVLTLAPPAKAVGIAAKMGIKGLKTFLVREGAYLIRSAKNVMNPKVLIEMGKRAFTATKKGPIAKTAQGVKDHIKDMKKIGYTLKYLGGNVEDLLVLEKVGPDIIEKTAKNKSAKEIMEMIKDKALSNIEKAKETLVRFGGKGTGTADDLRKTKIPTVRNGKFNNWFDELSTEEFNKMWENPQLRKKIEDRIRQPGGYHEWHLVARTPKFKEWGIPMEDIKEMRTFTKDVKFINPSGVHGGEGSTVAHNQILRIIDTSKDYDTFVKRLNHWAEDRLENGKMGLPEGLRR